MPRNIASILIACAAWLPASAALATGEPPKVQLKPAAPEGAPTVVAPLAVEATSPAELRKQTYSFVDTFAASTPRLDQYARWGDPVCVTVQGLPSDEGAKIKARVEEVAKALGVRVLGGACGPNLEIKFADQPQAFLDQVAATHEDLLGYWHSRDRDKLKAMTHPIQAWYRTASIGGGDTSALTFATGGGASTNTATSSALSTQRINGELIDDPDLPTPTGCGGSRFSSCLRSVFNHVLVVVDTGAVKGAPEGLVADYVAMVSMAQARSLDGCNALKSVIDIYAEGCRGRSSPDGLTRADVSFLTSLYKTNPEGRKASQETDIASRMSDMLLKANKMDRLARDKSQQVSAAK